MEGLRVPWYQRVEVSLLQSVSELLLIVLALDLFIVRRLRHVILKHTDMAGMPLRLDLTVLGLPPLHQMMLDLPVLGDGRLLMKGQYCLRLEVYLKAHVSTIGRHIVLRLSGCITNLLFDRWPSLEPIREHLSVSF